MKYSSISVFGAMTPGGTLIYKGRGSSSEIFKRTPERCQDLVLWVWLDKFSPLRSTWFSNISCHTVFWGLNTGPKRCRKTPAVDLLTLKTLRGTKTALLTPKGYDEHPRPFCKGVSPREWLYSSRTKFSCWQQIVFATSEVKSTKDKERLNRL